MGLRLKFNLVLVVVFLAGFAAAGYITRQLLQDNAREEVLRNARLMMDTALSVRSYTVEQIKPHLDKQLEEVFLPQSVPAYAATETLNQLQKKYRDYGYKEATLNPTNPRNRATDWEADLVQQFRQNAETMELVSERNGGTGRQLYIAKPIQISNAACLQCHSVPGNAPASMIKVYGDNNGFGWKHNEIIGAQVVTVPMDIPIHNADRAFRTFMLSLAGVFAVVFVVLNVMLSWLIVRPIRRMSQSADKVSTGDFDVPEFTDGGRDEVAVLGSSFNRMRRSLEKAMQMIGD
ncbi:MULTISPECIES: c-type heme family protein [Polaromonas]|uniref:histidine kinase n=1 Tax=Polaromonas aquatica TaxID=332657 RepID=A0ABW1TZ56_9BURK